MVIQYLNFNQRLIFFGLLLFGLFSCSSASAMTLKERPARACTMDAFMCPDGSYVGRTGPNCEFVCTLSPTGTTSTSSKKIDIPVRIDDTKKPLDKNFNLETKPIIPNPSIKQPIQSTLSEIDQKRVINLAANVSNRLDAIVARLANIADRIEDRILILKQKGFDVGPAEIELQKATSKLIKLKELLSKIDVLVNETMTSKQPYANWQSVKTYYQEIIKLVKETNTDLKTTIELLKKIINGQQLSTIDSSDTHAQANN